MVKLDFNMVQKRKILRNFQKLKKNIKESSEKLEKFVKGQNGHFGPLA